MVADLAAAKGFSIEQLAAFGVRQSARGVEIPYFDALGAESPRVRLRTAVAARDGSSWSEGTDELVPYGLNRPIAWEKQYAFVVEGETDCWALWTAGKPALGVPGASNAKCLRAEHVAGATSLYVVREPGVAGARFPHKVADRLYSQGYTGAVYAIDLEKAKDPLDLWRQDPENFEADLRAAMVARELLKKPERAPASKTGVVSLAELIRRPRKKSEFLVDGLLPRGGIMLTVASPKAGKSKLMRTLARSVALGESFLGRDVLQGSVVWARLEEPYDEFLDDLSAMGAADFADRFFTNEEMPPVDVMRWFDDVVREHHPTLAIIDTWAKLTRVDDISNYSKVNAANEPLMRYARNLGIAQVWIHHSGKSEGKGGKAVLGSTALFGACDTLMVVERYPNDVRAVSTQQRIGEDMPETQIAMNPETGLITVAAGRSGIRNGQIEQQIIEIVLSDPGTSKSGLVDMIEARKSDVLASIAALEERGVIRNEPGSKGAHRYFPVLRNSVPRSADTVPDTVPGDDPRGSGASSDQFPDGFGSVPKTAGSPPSRGTVLLRDTDVARGTASSNNDTASTDRIPLLEARDQRRVHDGVDLTPVSPNLTTGCDAREGVVPREGGGGPIAAASGTVRPNGAAR